MQEAKATTVTVKALEDSLDFIDKAIDASDAEEKRRKAKEERKAIKYIAMDSFTFDLELAERSMRRMSNRRPPYPVWECPVCHGMSPNCPHRRNPNWR